jgi:hypothetical protein
VGGAERYEKQAAPWVALPCGHASCIKCLHQYAAKGLSSCPTCAQSFLPKLKTGNRVRLAKRLPLNPRKLNHCLSSTSDQYNILTPHYVV